MITVSLISLGCAKNLVDSEIMVGHLHKAGMRVIPEADQADVVIVNTCSFIDSSKEESIGHILEAHERRGLRKRRRGQKLIVAGCMSQRFSKDLPGSHARGRRVHRARPDHPGRPDHRGDLRDGSAGPRRPPKASSRSAPPTSPTYDTPRFRLTPAHYAYVKIAEGCNHPCTFCIIPQIRGRHRSRTVASVVAEVRQLVSEGVKEINLISQDTTFFGMDTWEERPNPRTPVDSSRGSALTSLLRELNAIEGDFWIRILYTHPAHWSDELIATIAECPKVARYVDMPLQHISDRMLSAMQRETGGALHPRPRAPDSRRDSRASPSGRRSSSGFPGETEADVDELCEFIRESQIRAARRVPLLAGGGHARGQDAGTGARKGEGAPLAPSHGASEGHSPRRSAPGASEGPSGSSSTRSASRAARPTRPTSTAACTCRASFPSAASRA